MADPNIYPTYRDSFVNPNLPNVSYVGQDTQSAFETMPDNRARQKPRSPRPDTPGWTPPDGPATQAIVQWYNKKTGERHSTTTGGWTPPSDDWIRQGQPGYVRIPETVTSPGEHPRQITPPEDVTVELPYFPSPGIDPVEPAPKPISPYEGYTSDEIRGFVDKSLGSIFDESGLGQSFKVDTGDSYRTVDWEDKGFTSPENPPDNIPQIFWNPETKEIVQVPTGGFSPPEGWVSYSGQYIDRIDVPDFGDEPDKIIKDLYKDDVDIGDESGDTQTYKAWFEKERLNPEWTEWKQGLDDFLASLPEVPEGTTEVPRGPTYDLVFDGGASDSLGNQLFQMLKDSGRKMSWNPQSKKLMIDDGDGKYREIRGIQDLKDLYKEEVTTTGRTLNVSQGMQAIDFYKNNLFNSSATSGYHLTYTRRALKTIKPDTSYLDAIIHNEKLRNDYSYKDMLEGNVSDAVLLTQEYIDSVKDQVPTDYSTATPRSWRREIGPVQKTPEEIEAERLETWHSTNDDGDA